MKKTARRKKVTHISLKRKPTLVFRYIGIFFALFTLIFGVRILQGAMGTVHVLGVETGPVLLADHGGDSGESGGGSSGGDSGSAGSSGGGGSSSGDSSGSSDSLSSGDSSGQSGNSVSQPVSQDTLVDCVGPDGKHFTTSFHDCQEINQKWGRSNFNFTPLITQPLPVTNEKTKLEEQTSQGKLSVEQEGVKSEVKLETQGLRMEIKREDDGTVKVTAKKEDGTEIELKNDPLEQLNEALKEKEVEVATSSSSTNNLVLRKGEVEAETELPIGVDPTTHELTVTTPDGAKTVSVLPDEAVNNLLANKVFTSVETQVSSQSGTAIQKSTLTEVNNQPVFAVNGILQKKVLGLFPVGFAKTAFVSASNGSVVSVNEPLINRILEALSF